MTGLFGIERISTICLAVLTRCQRVTDRRSTELLYQHHTFSATALISTAVQVQHTAAANVPNTCVKLAGTEAEAVEWLGGVRHAKTMLKGVTAWQSVLKKLPTAVHCNTSADRQKNVFLTAWILLTLKKWNYAILSHFFSPDIIAGAHRCHMMRTILPQVVRHL